MGPRGLILDSPRIKFSVMRNSQMHEPNIFCTCSYSLFCHPFDTECHFCCRHFDLFSEFQTRRPVLVYCNGSIEFHYRYDIFVKCHTVLVRLAPSYWQANLQLIIYQIQSHINNYFWNKFLFTHWMYEYKFTLLWNK